MQIAVNIIETSIMINFIGLVTVVRPMAIIADVTSSDHIDMFESVDVAAVAYVFNLPVPERKKVIQSNAFRVIDANLCIRRQIPVNVRY